MSTFAFDSEVARLLDEAIAAGTKLQQLLKQEPPTKPLPTLEQARKKIRDLELELQVCEKEDRRDIESEIADAQAVLEQVEIDQDYAFGSEVDDMRQVLHDATADLYTRCRQLHDRHVGKDITGNRAAQDDVETYNHVAATWSKFRFPDPESSEALDRYPKRVDRLVQRLTDIKSEPERQQRQQLVRTAMYYSINPDGRSNLELHRRIESARWAEIADAQV